MSNLYIIDQATVDRISEHLAFAAQEYAYRLDDKSEGEDTHSNLAEGARDLDAVSLTANAFSPDDLALIAEALDSHLYWQLSDESRRDSGYVTEPHTDEEKECIALEDRVRKLIPPEVQAAQANKETT